jgi:hypothetical protein
MFKDLPASYSFLLAISPGFILRSFPIIHWLSHIILFDGSAYSFPYPPARTNLDIGLA